MSRKTILMAAGAGLAVAALTAGWFAYRNIARESPPDVAKPAPNPDEEIVLPDALDRNKKAVPSQKILVSEEKQKEAKRARLTGYICDEKLSGGTLRGVCYVPSDKEVELYPPMPLELTGTNAIQDPRPGEVAYFQNRPPLTPVWLGPYFREKKRYGVRGALIVVKGVAAGKVPKLDSINFLLDYRSHELVAQKPSGENVQNPSWFSLGVAPPGELIRIVNLTLYDSDLVIRRADTGNVLETIPLKGYSDKRYPGAHLGANPDMADPPTAEISRIREPGLYAIACPRHPWQKAYLCVPDSPYVALSEAESRDAGRTGDFVIPGVPPGKYTVEIWHPECEPVAKTYEVEILPDAETELAVAFKPPPALTQAPVTYPSKPITEWAFVGPFEPTDEAADAEVKKLNFDASYQGKYDRVQWEKVSLPKDGRYAGLFTLKGRWEPRVDATIFIATRFDCPAPQRLVLRVWSNWLNPQFILNGQSLFYPIDYREFAYGNETMVAGDLKQGANTLLVRVTGVAGDDSWLTALRIAYRPESVEAKAPEIKTGVVAQRVDKSSLVLTDATYWRCFLTRGPLRLNPRLLKDEKYLATRRDLFPQGMKRIENGTKELNLARNVDWTKTDWRDRALWYPLGSYQSPPMISMLDQPPPPRDWMHPDFDDQEWMMLWNTRVSDAQLTDGLMVWNWYMRTDFTVPDGVQPGDLALKMVFHGGARVFVNGVEVVRSHLPPGELAPDAIGEEYPQDAYLARIEELPDSPVPRQVPDLRTAFQDGIKDSNKDLERFRQPASAGVRIFLTKPGWDRIRTARDRRLDSVAIPAKLLRKGRNVLAVEIRGSLHHPDIWNAGWGARDSHLNWAWWEGPTGISWAHAELLELELRDPSGAIPPAMEPKKGLQVWAEDMHTRVLDLHTRPSATPIGTVRMVGALNGAYSGMVVVRHDREIADLRAAMSDLKADGRPGTIPAGAMKVTGMVGRPLNDLHWLASGREAGWGDRYLRNAATQASQSPLVPKRQKTEDWQTWFNKIMARVLFYDDIGPAIPERVPAQTAQPLWMTLKVPMETEPGVYKGSLAIQARGLDNVTVPVEVEVIGWRVPNPQEFKTDAWLEQHPYAIANHYLLPKNAEAKPGERNWEGPVKAKVPLWSDEHFKLMEASFQQLARAGNDVLHIPVVNRTEFGNWQDSMVRWIRKKDGTLTFDYAILDRYLDLAVKYLGRPRVIDFVIMHCMQSAPASSVMVYDESAGKTEELNVGFTSDVFQRLSAWKTFAASLLRHMKEKGLEHSVYWGHGGDYEPDPGLMSYLIEVFPGTYWSASGHTYHGGAGGGGHSRNIVRCFSDVYGSAKPLLSAMGWKGPSIGNDNFTFDRDSRSSKFKTYRADESYLYIHNPRDYCNGPTLPMKWRSLSAMALRNGYSGVGRVGLDGYDADWLSGTSGMDWGFPGRPGNMLTWPGPNGAESSARFEALLEGIQETEARIFLEQALDRGHVPQEAAGEVQRALDDHIRPAMMPLGFRDGAGEVYIYPWQSGSRLLFKTAAKVAELVGVDINNPDVALKVPALGQAGRDFKIRNWTGKPRDWKAASSAPWIVLPRTNGKLLGFEDFAFVVDGKNLKPGETVKGAIVITDTANGRQSTFAITAAVESPVIVTYDHPHFNMTAGRTETREYRVANKAITDQTWQLSAPVPWIKIEPSSGTLKPGEEQTLTLTAAPPDKRAVYENEFVFKAAGGLGDSKFISKTFVIPLLREKEDRAMPPGKIIKIEDAGKQFKSGVYCKNGTIIETGLGVKEWGAPQTRNVDFRGLFASPRYTDGSGFPGFLPLIGKEKFSRAMWVFPHAEAVFNLEGTGITGFSAYVGISKDAQRLMIRHPNYRANFEIYVDGEVRMQSGLMLTTDEPRYLTVENLKGAKEFKLVTRLDCDKDDPNFVCTWADAQFYAERDTTPAQAGEAKK